MKRLGVYSTIMENIFASSIGDIIWYFDFVGYYGSFFVTSIVFLRLFLLKKFLHSVLFLIGSFLNFVVDVYFKGVFEDPRPRNPISMKLPCWSWIYNGCLTNDDSLYRGLIQYGFPSGHAQSVLYATSFLYFIQGGVFNIWLWLCLFVCCLTLIQRYKYRRHTIEQLIAGSLLGSLVGYSVYYLTKKTL